MTGAAAAAKRLDVICIGRSSVDLYGEQIGGRLEDMASFAKYVGGCPTNISIGAARLGLKPGLITAVGDEHMGRFIEEQCAREGVDVRGVKTDPQRLTALVILGIRDRHTFPLIFVRENCADAALCEDDVDEDYSLVERKAVDGLRQRLDVSLQRAAALDGWAKEFVIDQRFDDFYADGLLDDAERRRIEQLGASLGVAFALIAKLDARAQKRRGL